MSASTLPSISVGESTPLSVEDGYNNGNKRGRFFEKTRELFLDIMEDDLPLGQLQYQAVAKRLYAEAKNMEPPLPLPENVGRNALDDDGICSYVLR